jgi:hypothetical protein
MYTAAGTPDLAASGFAIAGLTVGRTSAVESERSRSPEVRTFSSVMAMVFREMVAIGLVLCREKRVGFEVQRLPRLVEERACRRRFTPSTADETGWENECGCSGWL